MTSPKINPCCSVIIPVFNAAATINDTIASVRAQTLPDFEIIAVDDGSTDDSLAILLAIAAEEPRLRVVSVTNGGVSAARNLGSELAKGELIAFLDADDLWMPEKLQCHHAAHQVDPDLALSFAQIRFLWADTRARRTTYSTVPSGPLTAASLLAENAVCTTSNIVVRRDVFATSTRFRPDMRFAEDQEWLISVARAGHRLAGLNLHLVDYRMSEDGLSANLDAMFDGWRMVQILHGCLREPSQKSAAEALYCRYLARRALRTGAAVSEVRRFTWQGLATNRAVFLADRFRGFGTLFGAIICGVIPGEARRRLFA
jgi:Glycosyl transferase family 2